MAALFVSVSVMAQGVVEGVVVDAATQEPIVGAAVTVGRTTVGVVTKESGQFSVSVAAFPTELVITYVGYQEQRLRVDAPTANVRIAMVNLLNEDDNSDFTFTESQLADEEDAQVVASIVSNNNDPYTSRVRFVFNGMRFKVRAYGNQYEQTYMNGLLLNDMERGNFSYSMIGGMNDATRNKEGASHHEYNRFGVSDMAGASNINARASQFAAGNKVTLSLCNRNYKLRTMYTYASGLQANGWAFAGSVGYRWANEGVIEGTFYNSFSYFLAAEKRINAEHSVSLVTFGAPTERAQQSASTEEAYWLANSHYYNPNWGYQNGKKRNARVVRDYEPAAIVTWDWNVNDDSRLSTSVGYKYAMYSNTALGWNGDAYDPRPDYYKNLPSSVFDVYDESKNNADYLKQNPYFIDQYNVLLNYWKSSKANRQINWDRMYYVNSVNEANGGEALYYQERRHNDQIALSMSSTWSQSINVHSKYSVGVFLNSTKGLHYKTMTDLLGATKYTDIDKFAVNDYGLYSDEAQNDLRNPNRQISAGDKFGYDYNINVNKGIVWGQYQTTYGPIVANASVSAEGTTMERDGKMQNGRAPENSYGKSGVAKFMGGSAGLSVIYHPGANHYISLSTGYAAKSPNARNSFVAPTMQNNYVNNLKLEKTFDIDLSYLLRFGDLSGVITGYYATFNDQVEQTAYYTDAQSTFTYLTMTDIEKMHCGIELALSYDIMSNLSLHVCGTISDAKYTNNPLAQISYAGWDYEELKKLNNYTTPTGELAPLRVIANGMRADGTPLTALNFGLKYNINGWYFEGNVNYYERVYVGFSQYRRLMSTYKSSGLVYTPTSVDSDGRMAYEVTKEQIKEHGGLLYDSSGRLVKAYAAHQECFDGGFMVNASVGKSIRMRGKSLSINLSVDNITNNTNMRTGGYEQNRDDYYYSESNGVYTKGEGKAYRFSKNSKYYYANSLNAFLNIGFKF